MERANEAASNPKSLCARQLPTSDQIGDFGSQSTAMNLLSPIPASASLFPGSLNDTRAIWSPMIEVASTIQPGANVEPSLHAVQNTPEIFGAVPIDNNVIVQAALETLINQQNLVQTTLQVRTPNSPVSFPLSQVEFLNKNGKCCFNGSICWTNKSSDSVSQLSWDYTSFCVCRPWEILQFNKQCLRPPVLNQILYCQLSHCLSIKPPTYPFAMIMSKENAVARAASTLTMPKESSTTTAVRKGFALIICEESANEEHCAGSTTTW